MKCSLVPSKGKRLLSSLNVQIGSGAQEPPIQWVPRAHTLAIKWLGCEAAQSLSSMVAINLYAPYKLSWMHRDSFTVTYTGEDLLQNLDAESSRKRLLRCTKHRLQQGFYRKWLPALKLLVC